MPVRTTFTHDRLAVEAKYPTGGVFRFSVSRSGERLALAGSHDKTEAARQLRVLAKFCNSLPGEDNAERIDRIAEVCKRATSISHLLTLISQES